ncbi:MAG: hypothetical protein LBT55_00255 [Clostridiaceae bacterium]|jgi:hypothetical protein|nr:hypothetical protein [Clostridiaceae bacterium]
MKKFDIKKVLLLLIAVIMIVALAACHKDSPNKPTKDEKPVDTGLAYDKFFDQFFVSVSKGVGGTAVNGSNDIVAKFNLDITLRLDAEQSVPVSLGITLFLDQTNGGKNSAFNIVGKLAFVDFDLTYLISDATNVYVKSTALGGTDTYVIPINIITEGLNANGETTNAPQQSQIASAISGELTKAILGDNSILSILKSVVADFGPAYSLDSTINKVLGLIPGVDINDLLGQVSSMLGIELSAEGGQVKISELLKTLGPVAEWAPATAVTDTKGNKGYELNIISDGLGVLASSLLKGIVEKPDVLNGALLGLLFSSTGANVFPDIKLSYTADANGVLSTIALKLDLKTVEDLGLDFVISGIEIRNSSNPVSKPTGAKAAQINLDGAINIASGLVVLNYNPTSTNSLKTWAGSAFPADFWTIGDTVFANTVDALGLGGQYSVNVKIVPNITGVDGKIQTKAALEIIFPANNEKITISFDGPTGASVLTVTGANGGIADTAARYALSLVASLLIDDTKAAIYPNDPDNAAIVGVAEAFFDTYTTTKTFDITTFVWTLGNNEGAFENVGKGNWFDLIQSLAFESFTPPARPSAETDANLYVLDSAGKLIHSETKAVGEGGKAAIDLTTIVATLNIDGYTFIGFVGNASYDSKTKTITVDSGDTVIKALYSRNDGLMGFDGGNEAGYYGISILTLLNTVQDIVSVDATSITIATSGTIDDLVRTVYGKFESTPSNFKFTSLKNVSGGGDYINADAVTKDFVKTLFAGSSLDLDANGVSIEDLLKAKATIKLENLSGAGIKLTITADFGSGKTASVSITASLSGVTI